jgi:hypothetical protein
MCHTWCLGQHKMNTFVPAMILKSICRQQKTRHPTPRHIQHPTQHRTPRHTLYPVTALVIMFTLLILQHSVELRTKAVPHAIQCAANIRLVTVTKDSSALVVKPVKTTARLIVTVEMGFQKIHYHFALLLFVCFCLV